MPHTAHSKIRIIILAGRRPEGDPVADMFGVPYKAAARFGERALMNRVIDAVDASGIASDIHILAQTPDALAGLEDFAGLKDRPDVHFVASSGSICQSLISCLDDMGDQWPVLVTTCDHVFLEADDLRTFVARAGRYSDIAVGLVEDTTVLAEHPDAKRTWLRFRNGAYTTCNLFLMQTPAAKRVLEFWADIEQKRKKPLQLALRFGPRLCLQFLFRRLSLAKAFRRCSCSLGAVAEPVILHRANLSIDVDKPADVHLVQQILGC